jgi:copper chaperone NosL
MKRMSNISRILVALASLALVAIYFLPVWFIFLVAPQYPEGLTMNIWLDKITGEVEIINGLNHYIGMKHISEEMFPEFGYMIYIVAVLIAFGLVVAVTGKRILLSVFNILLVALGFAAMYDFYAWGYKYGHELDPRAAIQVPGLTYQPPLVGHKTLLNFDAYSYPDIGGWVVIGVAMIFFGVWIYEWKRQRINKKTMNKHSIPAKLASVACLVIFASCNAEPESFQYGKDQCEDCRMTIMDPHFAAQLVTKKGRVFKFDDAHCLVSYQKKNDAKEVKTTVFNDFATEKFVDAEKAFFVQSPMLKSPMNGNAAAFASKEVAMAKAKETGGTVLTWNELKTGLQK